ncbi:MAG: hypothetical protein AVDCRST_MAG91-3850 [uncultured Sphingomonadaceae bacterium]|uniref:Ribonuclease VapC n=1 Tax=uncultured Sphingomonadaceae bacterium TaxID=169976 RepID=A0A6J4U8B6_9SPHN|nr:MAG: hypothetical protein AVDCRST_MAG91-3850 [uncultured Sphingomonadaceae bacterium]
MLYLDTALIVAALTIEEATTRAQVLLADYAGEVLVVSAWVSTEVAAALAVKVRNGSLTLELRDEAERSYRKLGRSVGELRIEAEHYSRAAELARDHRTGLRSGDALHLAIALSSDAVLCTLDKRFAQACDFLGVPHQLL